MKNVHTFVFVFAAVLLISTAGYSQQNPGDDDGLLRHVVLFKFKDTSGPADIKQIEEAFVALSKKIPLIKQFEWGTNDSSENLNQGLTHCFLVTFASKKDHDAYLVHPDHKAFVEILGPHLDKITVVDYWVK